MSECYYCGCEFGSCSCSDDIHREYKRLREIEEEEEKEKVLSALRDKAKPMIGKCFIYQRNEWDKYIFDIVDVFGKVRFKFNKMLRCRKLEVPGSYIKNTASIINYYFENNVSDELYADNDTPFFYWVNLLDTEKISEISREEFDKIFERYEEFNPIKIKNHE